jgi:hypothetical protein
VGLAGLEPAASSLSEIDSQPLCYLAFLLVGLLRKSYKDGVNCGPPSCLRWRSDLDGRDGAGSWIDPGDGVVPIVGDPDRPGADPRPLAGAVQPGCRSERVSKRP